MPPHAKSTRVDYVVNPQDPATWLKPDEPLIGADGRDWSWTYVWFKDVPGFPGRKIGFNASVWTCCRTGGAKGLHGNPGGITSEWRRQALRMKDDGHIAVRFWRNKKNHYRAVHRLLLEAFWCPCPAGLECCHNNGIPWDNRFLNLRWDTQEANYQDAIRHGVAPRGERHGCAKITAAKAVEIFLRIKNGERQARIAEEAGLSVGLISDIWRGNAWNDATSELRKTVVVGDGRRRNGPPCGSGHPQAKLAESDIPAIRDRYARGESMVSIARSYDVSKSAISRAIHGWKHAETQTS